MKVLILGSKGNLGQDLVRKFTEAGHEAVGFDRDGLDVTKERDVATQIVPGRYDAVINAVAWNDVDGAEDAENREAVWELNAAVPGRLARAASGAGAAFVHYSSDYVFPGKKADGYSESDRPEPLSAYGESKLAGEQRALAAGGRTYVCRLSKLYGKPGTSGAAKPSFVSLMLALAAEKPALKIVDDEVGCPSYTPDVAEATVRLLTEGHEPGVYHIVNDGPGVTWHGFAEEFFGLLGVDTPREPVPSSAFPQKARRPSLGKLNNTKFPALRTREEALKAFFVEYPELVPEKFRERVAA